MRYPDVVRRLLVLCAAVSFASCFGPTEIVMTLTTDVACSTVAQNGIAISIGRPGDDTNSPAAETRACTDGGIGSLVVVPSGAADGVGIRVVLGVGVSVDQCDDKHAFKDCIVARRSLLFDPHRELLIPIELQASCAGVQCTPTTTCVNASCVDAGVTCANGQCGLPDAGTVDAGMVDAGACVAMASVPVAKNAQPFTPHIAKIAGGYALTWVSAGVLLATTVSSTGVLPSTPPLPMLNVPTGGLPGPLGSDGSNVVTFAMTSGNLQIFGWALDAGSAQASTGMNTLTGPLAGVIERPSGAYMALFEWPTPQIYLITPNPPNVPKIVSSNASMLNVQVGTSYGLARGGNNVYASWSSSQACSVDVCDAMSLNCTGLPSHAACTHVRFAVGASTWLGTIRDTGGQDWVWQQSPAVDVSVPADDPDAIIPIATGSTFQVIHRTADDLDVETFPGQTSAPTIAHTGYGNEGGTGAGFDAVSDDDGTSGWALVYWVWDGLSGQANGTLYFTHACGP
jgi:hypothetical protein